MFRGSHDLFRDIISLDEIREDRNSREFRLLFVERLSIIVYRVIVTIILNRLNKDRIGKIITINYCNGKENSFSFFNSKKLYFLRLLINSSLKTNTFFESDKIV